MKNVTLNVKLRSFTKMCVVAFALGAYAFAGSAFTSRTVNVVVATTPANCSLSNGVLSNSTFNYSTVCFTRIDSPAIDFVQQYISNEDENLQRMKVWGKRYFDMYDNILSQCGVPQELKYLSVIESQLERKIKSPVGAAGPWQIMACEARRVGLKVNSRVDERMDFTKSTYAAAKILNELHGLFGDWLLVVAAYNCGEVRVQQAIKKSGSKNYWDLQQYLTAQTRAHVKRFIGTHYIFEGNGGLTTMTADEIYS